MGKEWCLVHPLCGNCTASTDGALQTISPKSVIEPSVPGPVQAIFGQSPPTGGICPASTDDAQVFTPVSPIAILATKTAHYVIGQPTPIGGDCPASTDGARGFTSDDLAASELSILGPGCARTPAYGPGVVFGTLPVQAIFGQSTPKGGSCPASTNGAHGRTSYPADSDFSAPEPGCARPSADGPGVVSDTPPVHPIVSGGDCPAPTDGAHGFASIGLAAYILSVSALRVCPPSCSRARSRVWYTPGTCHLRSVFSHWW